MWVAVGTPGMNSFGNLSSTIQYSYNAVNWSNTSGGFGDGTGYGVAYGLQSNRSSMWVAVGSYSSGCSTIQYSGDGISWSNVTGGFTTVGRSVAYSSNRWVAVGDGGCPIQYSLDGMTWLNANNSQYFSQITPGVVNVARTPILSNNSAITLGRWSIRVNDNNNLIIDNGKQSVEFSDYLINSLNAFTNIQM
jgi:hypothetical protein